MSFHARHAKVTTAIHRLLEERPDLVKGADILSRHYLEGGLEKPSPVLLLAALRLYADDNFSTSAQHLSRVLGTTVLQTERHVADAVNMGPEFLKQDEDFLHGKGIMRGADKYFLGLKGIEPGGVYDRAWKVMDPAYRPVMAEAVQAAVSNKKKALGRRAMKYVAVLLMPEDDAKYFALNKLSMKSGKEHGETVRVAANFIRLMAQKHGIPFSETMLAGKGAAVEAQKPEAPRPRSEKAIRPNFKGGVTSAPPPPRAISPPSVVPESKASRAASDARHAARQTASLAAEGAAIKPDPATLKRQLQQLERSRQISEKEARLYLWLHTEGKHGERTIADAAEKTNSSERKIQIIVAHVNFKLRGLQASNANQPALSSDGDRHQARPVRP